MPQSNRATALSGTARCLLALLPIVAILSAVSGAWRGFESDRKEAYARGANALAAGDYPAALDAFSEAQPYADAARWAAAISARLPGATQAIATAADATARGDEAGAVAPLREALRLLPGDRETADLLRSAGTTAEANLRSRLAAAAAAGDWAAAEQAAASLVLLLPDDPAPAARLAEIRRDHAPILLAREQALWLVAPDGSGQRLLEDTVPATRPVWSPDRSRVAFVSVDLRQRNRPASLYVVGADGSGLRRVVGLVHPNALPSWNPDGRRIAYTSVASWDTQSERGLLAVHVVDVDAGTDEDVTSATGRHAVTPSWSPDGEALAFVSRSVTPGSDVQTLDGPGELYLYEPSGKRIRDLTGGRVPDLIRGIWSPGSDDILITTRTRSVTGGVATSSAGVSLSLLHPDGQLTTLADGVDANTGSWSPAWSSQGALAYVSGVGSIAIVDGERTTMVETHRFLSGALSWSPDGGSLLAASADGAAPSAIVRVGQDDPVVASVTLPFDTVWPTGTPQWSPILPGRSPAAAGSDGTSLDREPS